MQGQIYEHVGGRDRTSEDHRLKPATLGEGSFLAKKWWRVHQKAPIGWPIHLKKKAKIWIFKLNFDIDFEIFST